MSAENTIFSFRAECEGDVDEFLTLCRAAGVTYSVEWKPDHEGFPDVVVEMAAGASLESLQDLLRKVPDGHVMLQTFRACPLDQNSLKRDYDFR